MKKAFFGLSGGAGPMIRCLPICIELKNRGYDIFYYSRDHSSYYMDLYGFKQVDVSYPKRYDKGIGITKDWVDLEHFAATYENDKEYFFQKYSCWLDYMRELEPDIIISDFSLGSSLSGIILNIPVVSISQGSYLYPVKTHKNIRWWEDCDKPSGTRVLSNANDFFKYHGQNTVDKFEEIFLRDHVFIPGIPEFDEFNSSGLPVEFVGPILWPGENKASISDIAGGKDIIFVYLGRLADTCGDSGRIILDSIKDVSKSFDATFLISTANFDAIKEAVPQNVKVITDWYSIKDTYSSSKLVVHHGGHGSCFGTLVHGTPSIVIPTHTEREFNARMMEKMGVGKMIMPKDLNAQSLTNGIRQALDNDGLKLGSLFWKQTIEERNYRGSSRIVEYIESIVG